MTIPFLFMCLVFRVVGTNNAYAQKPSTAPTSEIVYSVSKLNYDAPTLRQRFLTWQLQLLEKLNRCDLAHLPRLEAVVAPETWIADELRYSPFPRWYPGAAQQAKVLIVHQPTQVFGGFEYGRLVRWGPVSTGRESAPTPFGLFHLNWKSTGRHSTVNPEWFMPWYFNFHNRQGLSLHEYSLPGYPASHACIRLLRRDAQWLYSWGEEWEVDAKGWTVLKQGTPVLILGEYDHEAPPPWRSLEWLATGIELPTEGFFEHAESAWIPLLGRSVLVECEWNAQLLDLAIQRGTTYAEEGGGAKTVAAGLPQRVFD